MGDLRNGDSSPDDGGDSYARDLPELPPEWRNIVIPDDLSGMEAEVRAVRQELRREERRRPTVRVGEREPVALRVPIVIMVVAVLMALVSLFVMTWGRAPARSLPVATATAPATDSSPDLSGLILHDASGAPVALDTLVPVVILLMDRCDCPGLPAEVAAASPAAVTVVVIGLAASALPTALPTNVRRLNDRTARLGPRFARPSGSGATAIIVDRAGRVVSVVHDVRRAATIGPITVS